MVYFAWVRSQSIWAPPSLEPQIIWDEEAADHKIKMKSLKIAKRYPLREGEADSGIDTLVRRYPPPKEGEPE